MASGPTLVTKAETIVSATLAIAVPTTLVSWNAVSSPKSETAAPKP